MVKAQHLLAGAACLLSPPRTAAGALRGDDDGPLPPMTSACDDVANSGDHEQIHHCDILRIVHRSSSYVEPSAEMAAAMGALNHHGADDPDHLAIGGLVELYSEESYFAPPMIIEGRKFDKYTLKNMITNGVLDAVKPEFIHPYEIYPDETSAFCNVGGLRKLQLTPCEVLSSSTTGEGRVVYEVAYTRGGEERVQERLPFSRVQRCRFIADRRDAVERQSL